MNILCRLVNIFKKITIFHMSPTFAHIRCCTLPPWPPPDHTSRQNTLVHHQLPLHQLLYAAKKKPANANFTWMWDKWDMKLFMSRYHDLADAVINSLAILAFNPDSPLVLHTHEGPHVTFIFFSMTHGTPGNLMRFASCTKPYGSDILMNGVGRLG